MTKFKSSEFEKEFEERTVEIKRVAKVVKGGRRFSFRAAVVMGDKGGRVGLGVGKANTVPDAIRKATDGARKDMRRMSMFKTTIPHEVIAKVGGARVLLRPASVGTGVIAGGPVRAILESVGVQDILTKSLGSSNTLNVLRATMKALDELKTISREASQRGKPVEELEPYWERRSS